MKRFAKVYIEISNICNLKCSFCPGTHRKIKRMTETEFETVLKSIKGFTDYIYFHLLGEPLCHPQLDSFFNLASLYGFKVIITTNGTLLKEKEDILLNSPAHYKTVISLHSFEANQNGAFDDYIKTCTEYAKKAIKEKIVVFRLWNNGGEDKFNNLIFEKIEKNFPKPWKTDRKGIKISNNLYLQLGDKFDWPDKASNIQNEQLFCYGLKDQVGILADGTVVPCCLDRNGDINLGNVFETSFEEIINSPRAIAIKEGFSCRKPTEDLCKKCSFAQKF